MNSSFSFYWSNISGIQTGSLYDSFLKNTFNGETLCPSSKDMLLVKTHDRGAGKTKKRACRAKHVDGILLHKAVYILRNPFNALVAYFNYGTAGMTKVAPQKMFTTESRCLKHAMPVSFNQNCLHLTF